MIMNLCSATLKAESSGELSGINCHVTSQMTDKSWRKFKCQIDDNDCSSGWHGAGIGRLGDLALAIDFHNISDPEVLSQSGISLQ